MKGISDRAGEKLTELLHGSTGLSQKRVRISVLRGRLRLNVDTEPPRLSDKVFKYNGQDVLVADFATVAHLAGSMLDYQDGQFRIA